MKAFYFLKALPCSDEKRISFIFMFLRHIRVFCLFLIYQYVALDDLLESLLNTFSTYLALSAYFIL